MKSFAFIVVLAQVAIFQSYAQVLRPALPLPLTSPCGCGGPVLPPLVAPQVLAPQVLAPQVVAPQLVSPSVPLYPSNPVANSLADTLSLLTVSSLLAETLPYGYANVLGLPALPAVPSYPCGCGGYPSYPGYPVYF